MDLSSVLLTGEGDSTTDYANGGEGIYSITVRSYNGTFVKCHTIEVDRSPSSTYPTPDGYQLMSSATSVSAGGVHIVEHFIPYMIAAVDTLILLTDTVLNPTEGAASGIQFKILTKSQRDEIYQHLDDCYRTFLSMMEAAGVGGNISSSLQTTRCLKELSFGYDTVNLQRIDGLLRKRITPATFMQIVYAGFQVVLVQVELNEWVLTDTLAMQGLGDPVLGTMDNIASIRNAYDFKKMAKSTHIALDGEGRVTESVIGGGNTPANIAAGSYSDGNLNRSLGNPGSIATGSDVEMSAPAMPLLRFAQFKGVTVGAGGKVKISSTGGCLGGQEIEAQATPIAKKLPFFRKTQVASDPDDVKYDISSINVVMRGMFAKNLHAMMSFRNKLESTSLNITMEGISVPAFGGIVVAGGGALQKVIIGPSSVTRKVEAAKVDVGGFVMSSTVIRTSGRLVSIVSYVNLKEAYPLVFS